MENGDPGELRQLPGRPDASFVLASNQGSSPKENGEDGVQQLPTLRGTLVTVLYTVVLCQWTMENGERNSEICGVPPLRGSEA